MPRARTGDAVEDVIVPKTRARRARAISMSDGTTPAPRKRAAPRTRPTVVENEPVPRKAPTPLADRRRTRSKNSKAFFGVLGVCVVMAAIGVGIGVMDSGTIDVVAVVNERNEKISKGEVRDELGNTVTQTLQVQSDTRPNGGLPMGDAPVAPPTPPVASTTTDATDTATSTETAETATTTPEEPA